MAQEQSNNRCGLNPWQAYPMHRPIDYRKLCDYCTKETRIYSVSSFPRKREPSKIKALDSRFRGDDE